MRSRPGLLALSWLGVVLPVPGWADHGAGATPVERSGLDADWLVLLALGAGAVLVVLLAAWVHLAPAREDREDEPAER